jgi:3-hydroxyacyl-CoA dehydrogenase
VRPTNSARSKRDVRLESPTERIRNLISLDANNVMKRLEARRDEMISLFSRLRDRTPMLSTVHNWFSSITFSDLVQLASREQSVVNQFYDCLDELRWYFTYTEDMPSTAQQNFSALFRRLEEAYGRLLAALGPPAAPSGEAMVVEAEIVRRPDTDPEAPAPSANGSKGATEARIAPGPTTAGSCASAIRLRLVALERVQHAVDKAPPPGRCCRPHSSGATMRNRIRKVAVLGAGVMGSGIAGHLANAGIPSLLLDIVPPKPDPKDDTASKAFRNKFTLNAINNLKKSKPASLYTQAALDLIEIGNFDDDLARIGECDWVIEVVKEDMAVKQALFTKVEPLLRPDAIISSNTSGLSIKGMTTGRSPAFKKNFLVTHFFNPVRYMKLLELIAGDKTDPKVVQALHHFGEEVLGKGIVYGKDSTNFIANRIGTYGIMRTLVEMQKAEMTVEEVDKIFGPATGRPKSAVFRTADIVGLDTFSHVAQNCYDTLTDDEERETFKLPAFIGEMVKKGMLGDKSGQGFYKKVKGEGGESEILSLNLRTLEYAKQQKVRYDSLGAAKDIEDPGERMAAVMNGTDKAAKLAERVNLDVMAYASRRIPEIADDFVNIDRALRWGFAWDLGPFQAWDAYGVQKGVARMKELGLKPAPWVNKMLAKGRTSFYAKKGTHDTFWDVGAQSAKRVSESERTIRVEVLKRGKKQIFANDSASLWDMDDGITLLEFHSKMNTVDDQIVTAMNRAIDETEKNFVGLVIGNDAENFSVGANIGAILMAIGSDEIGAVKKMVHDFQAVNQRMRYCSVPVVAAPFGLTLGGGAEIALGANAIQAAGELYMGLVEFGVGLIPGGGGTMALLRNLYGQFANDKDFDPLPFLRKVFLQVGLAKVATSAEEAREAGFLKPTDGITLNRDLLLADAKARALGMAQSGFRPPRQTHFRLPGRSGAAIMDMALYDMQNNNQISEHDRKIGRKLATVLTGGDTTTSALVSEQHLLDLELEAFMSLVTEPKTQERIMHMLNTGKPLRN